MSRDPRVDPRAGDVVLSHRQYGGIKREVNGRYAANKKHFVEWTVGRFGYRCTLAEWRKENAKSEVIHAAD